jgi:hypothetical protein
VVEQRRRRLQLILQLRADEQLLLKRLRAAGGHDFARPDVREREVVTRVQAELILRGFRRWRHGGGDEVMLKRGDPAVLDVRFESAVLVLLDVETAIAFAVGNRRPAVRVRFDLEIRALDVLVVTHDLHVRRCLPIAAAVVLDVVAQVDAIRAGIERVGLGDGDAVFAPGQRHDELRLARLQPVLVGVSAV